MQLVGKPMSSQALGKCFVALHAAALATGVAADAYPPIGHPTTKTVLPFTWDSMEAYMLDVAQTVLHDGQQSSCGQTNHKLSFWYADTAGKLIEVDVEPPKSCSTPGQAALSYRRETTLMRDASYVQQYPDTVEYALDGEPTDTLVDSSKSTYYALTDEAYINEDITDTYTVTHTSQATSSVAVSLGYKEEIKVGGAADPASSEFSVAYELGLSYSDSQSQSQSKAISWSHELVYNRPVCLTATVQIFKQVSNYKWSSRVLTNGFYMLDHKSGKYWVVDRESDATYAVPISGKLSGMVGVRESFDVQEYKIVTENGVSSCDWQAPIAQAIDYNSSRL